MDGNEPCSILRLNIFSKGLEIILKLNLRNVGPIPSRPVDLLRLRACNSFSMHSVVIFGMENGQVCLDVIKSCNFILSSCDIHVVEQLSGADLEISIK